MNKVSFTIILILISLTANAWGPTGHRVTGWVAEKHINKKVKKHLERLLGQESLAMAANWMDEIRSDSKYNYAEDWHWVTIPDGQTYQQTEKNSKGDVIEAIERLTASLKSGKLSLDQEREHLKMLIHLIGDIHQPLHVGHGHDRGGNDTKVTWFGSSSNLHRVWDSQMIDDTRLSYTELAASLEVPDENTIAAWQKSNVYDWAMESVSYRERIYNTGNGKLAYRYSYDNFHIVRLRLLQAGIRLAAVLNEIYG